MLFLIRERRILPSLIEFYAIFYSNIFHSYATFKDISKVEAITVKKVIEFGDLTLTPAIASVFRHFQR